MKLGLLFTLAVVAAAAQPDMPRYRWENFTTANGLPDNHVFNVCVDGNRVWAGTENGLALYENGKWTTYGTKRGLAHRAVLFISPDKRTGDVWIATMGGLSRFSAGRFDNYTQLNSGLPNDVVYGVAVQGDNVWAATAAGAGRFNMRTNQWSLFNERNTPMYEIWTYAVNAGVEQDLLRGVGRRCAGIRRQNRALEGLQRSRRRDRNGGPERPGTDPRDHDFGELDGEGEDPLGGHLLRREPLRRPQLEELPGERQRAAE